MKNSPYHEAMMMSISHQGDLPRDWIHQTTFPDWESLTLHIRDDRVVLQVTGDWLTQEDTIAVHGDGTLTITGAHRYCEQRTEAYQWQPVDESLAQTLTVIYRVDVDPHFTRIEGRNAQQQALRLTIEPGDLHWVNTLENTLDNTQEPKE